MDLPALVVTGNFDPSTGPLALWRGLELNAAGAESRQLLIGPWDHNQCYVGGELRRPGYDFGSEGGLDVVAKRIAFFNQHLKQQGPGPELPDRVTVYITGANEWRSFDSFPPGAVVPEPMHLASGGHANSSSGDGRLLPEAPLADMPPDRFVDDPEWPFVAAMASAKGAAFALDMRERERNHDTLVYSTGPLAEPMTLLGESVAEIFVSADVPDADLVVWLVEHRADGATMLLAFGQLRLRYHAGFEAECLLVPGEPVLARIPLTYIGHQLAAGSCLRLLISGNNFPLLDPNPHTQESIATASNMRSAVQAVHHDRTMPSRLLLPVLRESG
jgi:putative CocE/NonD family hydrolase